MGSIKTDQMVFFKDSANSESFYKWFLQVQSKLLGESFEDLKQEDEEYFKSVPDDQEEISLDQKRKIENVKRYLATFSNLDILLEFAEDKRIQSDFLPEFFSLEAFSVLGATTFFNAYLKREPETIQSLADVVKFVVKCKALDDRVGEGYIKGMESVLTHLKCFCDMQLSSSSSSSDKPLLNVELNGVGNDTESEVNTKTQTAISGIKCYFLSVFSNEFISEREDLVKQMLQDDSENPEWNLNKYYISRTNRLLLQNKDQTNSLPSENEKLHIETGFLNNNGKNPRQIIAVCQFLSDFLAGNGDSQLKLDEMQFSKHSDIVAFIRNQSIEILEKFPAFLRAYFTFAEIFGSELPITRLDREFAKSLLTKALEANPTSSKINHKMGLFLIKGRQFSEAKNFIRKSMELDAQNALAHYDLVKLLLRDVTGKNKELLESIFNADSTLNEKLGPENELPFWKGCYFFITGDRDLSVTLWVEVILQFYVSKPELDLETVLPFKILPSVANSFFWTRTPLTLDNVKGAVSGAINQEKTRKKVVFQRLIDIVNEAIQFQLKK